MAVWGKLIGGVLGYLLGGPLGAVLGAAFGHNLDQNATLLTHQSDPDLSPGEIDRVQMVFFTTTFALLGHLAKSDGQVTKSEIRMAEDVMGNMGLTAELRKAAIKLFDQGKQPEFELQPVIEQFRKEAGRRKNLYRMLLEILIQAAMADGEMAPDEEAVLLRVSELLGFPPVLYRQIEALVLAELGYRRTESSGARQSRANGRANGRDGSADSQSRRQRQSRVTTASKFGVSDAYQILGVGPEDDRATVKRAYRRLMSQHHPDKLVAKGLPEEMMKLATEKAQQIQKAYATIKEAKGWK